MKETRIEGMDYARDLKRAILRGRPRFPWADILLAVLIASFGIGLLLHAMPGACK